MNEILLDETACEAWCYILETMLLCERDEMKDADFKKFVSNLRYHYPNEFKAVLEVLRDKEFLNGL
jgi:hypothetical protein